MNRLARRSLCLVALAASAAAQAAAAPPTVAPQVRTLIQEYFRPSEIYPEATQWRFTKVAPYFGGTVYCGEANLQNGMRQYRGFRAFFVTIFPDGVHEGAMLDEPRDDPTGGERFKIGLLCGTSKP